MQATQFAPAPLPGAQAQALVARNLDLLRAIERTLDNLSEATKLFEAICEGYARIYDELQGITERIDCADSTIQKKLAKSAKICIAIYADAKARHASACNDTRLRADDGITDAYENFMETVVDTHDEADRLREWIAIHDAVLEPSTSAIYTNADDLIAALID